MYLRSPVYRDRYADRRPEGCICSIIEPGYVHEWCPVHDPDGTYHDEQQDAPASDGGAETGAAATVPEPSAES